ncbi:32253_t:CDS:1, partial [Racocetra persica]
YSKKEEHNTIIEETNNKSYKPKFDDPILDLIDSYFDKEFVDQKHKVERD